MKTVKQEALQQAIENLSIILQDEDLTDEKLRDYSEGLLPNTQDILIKALKQDDWIRIQDQSDLPNEDGAYIVVENGKVGTKTFLHRIPSNVKHWSENITSYTKFPEPPIY